MIPILVPLSLIHGKNQNAGVGGLDRLNWANIGLDHTQFYWAHLAMTVTVVIVTCYSIYAEFFEYVRIRQAYLSSPQYRLRAFANTILVTDISKDYLNADDLTRLYSVFPGGVRSIWINRDLSKLSKKIKRRKEILHRLEAAEIRLMKMALESSTCRRSQVSRLIEEGAQNRSDIGGEAPLWTRYLGDRDREHIRLPILRFDWMPSIPLVGRKVDTIDYCWQQIARLSNEIDRGQREAAQYPVTTSAFIQFNTQEAMYMACQSLVMCAPLRFTPQSLQASPRDVKWDDLSISWWNLYTRTVIANVSKAALIIAWSVPVAFTGLLSQVTYLTTLLPWLQWVNTTPLWLLGCIQGVLPQIVLTVLTMLLPYIQRFITERQGFSTAIAVEMSLQKAYFTFLFVQVFLTVSLSSSVTAMIQEILQGLTSIPTILATNLPEASNYFLSYLLLQGLSISAGGLLQIGRLVNWYGISMLTNPTPRQTWDKQTSLLALQWGTIFPIFTNLACIGVYIQLRFFSTTILTADQDSSTPLSLH